MKKLFVVLSVVVVLFASAESGRAISDKTAGQVAVGLAASAAFFALILSPDGVKQGVVCRVRDDKVIAADTKDCEAIGGKATREIVTKAEKIQSSDPGDQAVICQIKGQKVLSSNTKDCESIGGAATHRMVTSAHEIDS